MLRLFATLYLLILGAYVFFILTIGIIPELLVKLTDVEELEYSITEGTFNLLDQSVKGLDEAQRTAVIKRHQKAFGPLLNLVHSKNLNFDKEQSERIQQGLTVIIDRKDTETDNNEDNESTTIHYRKLPDTPYIWQVHLDIDVKVNNIKTFVDIGDYSKGMLYLMQTHLEQKPQHEWAAIIGQLQQQFAIPISLQKLQQANIEKQALTSLKRGEATNITQSQRVVTIAQRVGDSDYYLQAGPVTIPWNIFYMGHMVLSIMALFFATVIFLWIWPLWKNLNKLREAAQQFGDGKLETRVSYHKHSGTAPISAAFNAMAERTENTIRSHKELTTAVSHELRTPVARMRFSLDMLETTEDASDRQRYINNMNTDIEELNSMLEELLSYARFDQKGTVIKVRAMPLKPWFENTMQGLAPLTGEKTLSWQTQALGEDESAKFDPELMSRVVNNLVQNAFRYAATQIEITLSKTPDVHYIIMVDDDGEGIPEADRKRLFEAFATLDSSRNKDSEGFGLGLAIVKRIVLGHKGNVEIQNSPLGGSRFVVKWPKSNT